MITYKWTLVSDLVLHTHVMCKHPCVLVNKFESLIPNDNDEIRWNRTSLENQSGHNSKGV